MTQPPITPINSPMDTPMNGASDGAESEAQDNDNPAHPLPRIPWPETLTGQTVLRIDKMPVGYQFRLSNLMKEMGYSGRDAMAAGTVMTKLESLNSVRKLKSTPRTYQVTEETKVQTKRWIAANHPRMVRVRPRNPLLNMKQRLALENRLAAQGAPQAVSTRAANSSGSAWQPHDDQHFFKAVLAGLDKFASELRDFAAPHCIALLLRDIPTQDICAEISRRIG